MTQVVEINDPNRLREFHLAWRLLLPQTRQASFFQSLDWLECYWRHFGGEQRLRLIVILEGTRPLGIVPLVVRNESLRVGRYRVLTYPLHDWGTFYGPIGPNPTASLVATFQHLRATPRDWDILDLRWVDREGGDQGRTASSLSFTGYQHAERVWKRTAVVDLRDGWDRYFSGFTSKHRSELRRLERRLEAVGELQFERFRPEPQWGDISSPCPWYEQCVQLAERSWQGRSSDGTTLSHTAVADYLRDNHHAALKAGAVDVSLLRLDGQLLAFAYNLHYLGRVYGLRTGFDPTFAKLRPGAVLWKRMLEDSCSRGDTWVDLGPESPQVKKRWATQFASSFHYRHYAAGTRNTVLRMKDWLVERRQAWRETAPQHSASSAE